MSITRTDSRFIYWAGVTLVLLYLVILAGSVVRATGSGMGCPDWPKCFGYYIPPTEQSQIEFQPNHDYNKGMMIIANDTLWISTEHFTSAESFDRAHWKKYPKHDYAEFNPAQTWTEYINRLCGALSGLASLVMLYYAFARRRHDAASLWLVIGHFIVLLFVAWLGKVVVDSNLKPVTITLHMLCALIMVFLMITVRVRARALAGVFARVSISKGMRLVLWFSLVFTLAQIVLGTQVRQQVDALVKASLDGSRETWIATLTSRYTVHFTMAMVLTGLNIFIWLRLRNQFNVPQAKTLLTASLLVVFVTYGAGVIMHRFAVPAMVQPVHLLGAMVLAGVQFGLILRTK
jgi:cytochrome c oxidase assembly protein subunit 15